MRLFRIVGMCASALILASCGLGGGGGNVPAGPTQPFSETSPIRNASGGDPLNLTPAQIRQAIKAKEQQADSVNSTNVLIGAGIGYRVDNCRGTSCRILNTDIYLSDFDLDAGSYEPIMTRNGVRVVQGANRIEILGVETDYQMYGGWTDHSMFFGIADRDAGAFALSAGNKTGSAPRGGAATWRGVMVGGDASRNEAFQGDATLRADFGASNIDIAFTNVHEVETGSSRNSIRFNDVPFTSDGFAKGSRRSGGNYIEGTFYGPNHAEAGGVFETDSATKFGAFGASR